MSHRVISYDATEVQFENGARVKVAPFQVRQHCVPIVEMLQFCQAAGYRTSAEVAGKDTYLTNSAVMTLSKEDWEIVPACCLSYRDALAFCEWQRVRLPTEAEYLAFALLTDEILSYQEARARFFPDGNWNETLKNAVHVNGAEICSLANHSDRCVWRMGPKHYRRPERGGFYQERVERGLDAFDLLSCFRYVLLDS